MSWRDARQPVSSWVGDRQMFFCRERFVMQPELLVSITILGFYGLSTPSLKPSFRRHPKFIRLKPSRSIQLASESDLDDPSNPRIDPQRILIRQSDHQVARDSNTLQSCLVNLQLEATNQGETTVPYPGRNSEPLILQRCCGRNPRQSNRNAM